METNTQNSQQSVNLEQALRPESLKKSQFKPLWIILFLVLLIIIGSGGYYLGTRRGLKKPSTSLATTTKTKLIGGDKDSHGCLIGAGYFWCDLKKKCLRIWEEPCSNHTPTPITTAENWHTYTGPYFAVQYPSNWFVNKYEDSSGNAIEISDKENSIKTIFGESDTYTRIEVRNYGGKIPANFPYTNGEENSQNSTIKPFATSKYKGIRGQQTSEAGLLSVVYLENPKGGYVQMILISPIKNPENSKSIFEQMLSSFKFTNEE
jgi:hypothetical protein